jgi:hypothetical protein
LGEEIALRAGRSSLNTSTIGHRQVEPSTLVLLGEALALLGEALFC